MADQPIYAASKRQAARRKLLNLLGRIQLESLSGLQQPWNANKSDLIDRAASDAQWDADEVRECVEKIFARAAP